MNLQNKKISKLVFSAVIAAIYTVLTLLLAPISYGQIQVRVSESLTLLPFLSSYSIWGVFLGCIISNLIGGNGIIDVVFGSLATLIAAILTYYIGKSNLKFKKYLAPLPPIIINAVVIGFILNYTLKLPLLLSIIWVGLGEAISCYVLGLILISIIEKNKKLMYYFKY
ncbi:queuosine precursor transporter QueT [Clostridium sporogenes]|uniref:QueT transporter family protein n=1 Tax=Clostridium botulinum TaxID=1491 RepID=UPI0007176732|nr:QueT transporter family protein [Clostridium botulinum]KRU24766.1 queuosine precursor transporter QueT [Clostridium sporogenes]KRU28494.1 queuosine precursor transporter QueT [Clostridium sporogenes]KRU29816.1 queuosine precursor transporter QueT [Clostridium sporogenes]KRU37723.1 queuosine precursor transporter QueT [Clostridium sporogenes]MBZ1330606.1 QueT transporter family protein [Clostridium botulinum]